MTKVTIFLISILLIITIWLNINLGQTQYNQIIYNEYFFASNGLKSTFKGDTQDIHLIYSSVEIKDSFICQGTTIIQKNSKKIFQICEDTKGQIFQKIRNKKYILVKPLIDKTLFYSFNLFDDKSFSCKSKFRTEKFFGLNREILELECQDNKTYKFAKGMGLIYYKDNEHEIVIDRIEPFDEEHYE